VVGGEVSQGEQAHTLLRRLVEVRDGEVRAMLVSFAYFFFVLSGWFVMRPMREAVAVATGVNKLPYLFAATLTAVLLANPLFSALVVRYPVRKFIAITYQFFVACILVFYALMTFVAPQEGSAGDVWIGRAYYVWTSVFNLFVVSIFWAFMADSFRSEQAKRLFGFIAVGGTLGSVLGSATTAQLAPVIGTPNLLLVSAALIELAVVCVMRFPVQVGAHEENVARLTGLPIGGTVWAGVTNLLKSRYLLGIAGYFVLFTMGSTILYFQQADIVGKAFADRAARTAVMARIELVVQSLTLITQVFLTGRLIRWLGLSLALAFLPFVSMAGFAALGTWPTFAVVATMAVLRRAGNFALSNPALEILFTVIPREDKYKAKNFIETFVYRTGDQAGAWGYAGLAAVGLGLAGISYAAVPLALVWLLLGHWLGREQGRLAIVKR
jgi:AAA family ATP:ADP antiporter